MMKAERQRVLVTGSEGYIGTILIPMLQERGYEVVGMDIGFVAHRRFASGISSYPLVRKDVRDVQEEDVTGFDAVYHLAALSNDPLGEINPDLTDAINHRASVRLARLARDAGVRRFLFASSCSIYGAGQSDRLDEEVAFNPLTAYARSKVAAEEGIYSLASADFSPIFLRNGTAFGLSPRMRFDLVLNNLTGWAHTTGEVKLLSDGTAWRPLVHIRDIATAMIAGAEAPRELVHNQAYNVGVTDANYQIRAVAEAVEQVVPDTVVTFADGVEADTRNYNVSFDKIHTRLKDYFIPNWSIEDGITEILNACVARGLSFGEFDSPEYMTIKGLKRLLAENKLDENLRWRNND